MFVGQPLCRDEEWLEISVHYTENVFTTVMALRMVPKVLHPFLVWLVPSSYRIHHNLQRAKKLIMPLVQARREEQQLSMATTAKPDDMLQWMMDAANASEGHPAKLAHRQLILTLGAIHTTTMAATHALLDLCAHPEYIEPLRTEVTGTLASDTAGGKAVFTKLRLMDSFLKESQRHNPPNILAFNRVAMQPLTLSDGALIPKGTHFVVPSAAILMDPATTPDPLIFDPMRAYRRRTEHSAAGDLNRHQYTTTTASELHFGHGKYACPGRFFAGTEIKMLLSFMLMHYEMRAPGQQRTQPCNFVADDNIFPEPEATIVLEGRAS